MEWWLYLLGATLHYTTNYKHKTERANVCLVVFSSKSNRVRSHDSSCLMSPRCNLPVALCLFLVIWLINALSPQLQVSNFVYRAGNSKAHQHSVIADEKQWAKIQQNETKCKTGWSTSRGSLLLLIPLSLFILLGSTVYIGILIEWDLLRCENDCASY